VLTLNPFDLTGGPFLLLYGLMLVAAIAAGALIPRRMRPEGRRQEVTDPDMLAMLGGGRTRFADGVVARLLTRGDLRMASAKTFAPRTGARGGTAAEIAILTLSAPIEWSTIAAHLRGYAEPVETKLARLGLWIDKAGIARLRFWQTLPYVVLIGFGAIKLMVGEARHRPVGILTSLLILTLILAAVRWLTVDRRTAAAVRAIADAQLRHSRLKIAPTADEAALGVALFGTMVLSGSAYGDFHRLRTTTGDSGSGGGDGSGSDGGGGCSGGGCGGCGS
jgi:uncharacterized protein (TIGR04222 family)